MKTIKRYLKAKHIGENKLAVLDKIEELTGPEFIVTGSLSLWEHDIITRTVNDIDIFMKIKGITKLQSAGYKVTSFLNRDYGPKQNDTDISDLIAQLYINDVKVDIFEWQYGIVHKKLSYLGSRRFNVAVPGYSIAAKEEYLKNDKGYMTTESIEKHESDIRNYNEWLKLEELIY